MRTAGPEAREERRTGRTAATALASRHSSHGLGFRFRLVRHRRRLRSPDAGRLQLRAEPARAVSRLAGGGRSHRPRHVSRWGAAGQKDRVSAGCRRCPSGWRWLCSERSLRGAAWRGSTPRPPGSPFRRRSVIRLRGQPSRTACLAPGPLRGSRSRGRPRRQSRRQRSSLSASRAPRFHGRRHRAARFAAVGAVAEPAGMGEVVDVGEDRRQLPSLASTRPTSRMPGVSTIQPPPRMGRRARKVVVCRPFWSSSRESVRSAIRPRR